MNTNRRLQRLESLTSKKRSSVYEFSDKELMEILGLPPGASTAQIEARAKELKQAAVTAAGNEAAMPKEQ